MFRGLLGFCVVLCLLIPSLGFAQTFTGTGVNPRTPEALARGNVSISMGGDYNALFYNPAGLSTVGDLEIQAIAPMLETNPETRSFLNDSGDLINNPAGIATFLASHVGDSIYARGNSISYVTTKSGRLGFGAAVLFDWTVEQAVTGDGQILTLDERLYTRKTTNIGAVLGGSFDVIEKWVAVGGSLKILNRWVTIDDEDIPGLAASLGVDGNVYNVIGDCGIMPNCVDWSEFGVGGDLALQVMLPFDEIVPGGGGVPGLEGSRLQAAAVWQDVGRTHFDSADIPQTIDVGVAWVQSFGIGNFKIGADFRDLNRDVITPNSLSGPLFYGDPDYTLGEKTSLGAELEFKKYVTLRAGINETGGAVGAALRFGAVRLQGGFFQEKTDLTSDGRDNRFFVQLGAGWYN